MADNMHAYAALTGEALQALNRSLPANSRLLADVMTEPDPAPAIPRVTIRKDSAPASVPSLAY